MARFRVFGPRGGYARGISLVVLGVLVEGVVGCGAAPEGAKHGNGGASPAADAGEARMAGMKADRGKGFAGEDAIAASKAAADAPALGAPPPAAEPAPAGGEEFNRQNAEQYGVYRENEFVSPRTTPLSTFSADVNTASYSNVRRMLLDSVQLPPRDAVFLAEFVNYFPYQYARPKGPDPVAFALEIGPCPWKPEHHLVRVGVQARQLDPRAMPARNLVFLIDTSGSMQAPNRLPLVKQSLGLLIDQLTERDTVGVVTYAGAAGVALEPTSGADREVVRQAVDRLGAGGSTNGSGGLRAAYDLARRNYRDGAVNRVILCTDGDFNVGVTGQGELVKLIEDERKSGVFLTVLGFGMGNYKDQTLKAIANHGNGHHAYIDDIDEARKVFVDQGGALALVAKDVKFQVEFNPAKVAAYRLIGYENRLLKDEDFKNDAKDAGDMGSGHQVTVLYEVVPVGVKIDLPGVDPLKYQAAKGEAAPSDEWLTAKMRYKQPDGEVSQELGKPLAGVVGKELSDDFRWAAAVAAFGQLLRDSPHKGGMTYAGVLEEASAVVGPDPTGHRREFVGLVTRAAELNRGK
ncbi:MAG: VWA domain-containing protein [Gemmataceae bacterium]|nr:VWA domain-containing protein [Gemmataceae bacterium]